MTKDTLISTYGKHIAEDMFQQLCAHISDNPMTIAAKDDSFHLIGALNEIRDGLMLPPGMQIQVAGLRPVPGYPFAIFHQVRLWPAVDRSQDNRFTFQGRSGTGLPLYHHESSVSGP